MVNKNSQGKYWKSKGLGAIQSYWDSPPASKRSVWFCQQLKKYDFKSIFEVGYFSGRNLKYIREEFVDVEIGGLEISPKAVKFARNKLSMPHLKLMNLHDMDQIEERFDIVFTSGVLIHIPPEDVKSVVQKMMGMGNKYVMHLEELGVGDIVACPKKKMKPKKKVSDQWQWNVNLVSIYQSLNFEPIVISLPDDVRTNGAKELVVIKI
jgi:hypothetical protein